MAATRRAVAVSLAVETVMRVEAGAVLVADHGLAHPCPCRHVTQQAASVPQQQQRRRQQLLHPLLRAAP